MKEQELPKYAYIADMRYEIKKSSMEQMQKENMTQDYLTGLTYYRKCKIILADDVVGDQLRRSLLHEICHAIFSANEYGEKYAADEDLVDMVARGMRQFCKDNPELAKYVLGCEK